MSDTLFHWFVTITYISKMSKPQPTSISIWSHATTCSQCSLFNNMNWQDGGGQKNEILAGSTYDFNNATFFPNAILTLELLDIKVFSPLHTIHTTPYHTQQYHHTLHTSIKPLLNSFELVITSPSMTPNYTIKPALFKRQHKRNGDFVLHLDCNLSTYYTKL